MHPAEIKAALEIAGFNQADLARELDISRAAVSKVINGRERNERVVRRVAAITNRSLDELWPQWYGDSAEVVLTKLERELLDAFRAASEASRNRALRALGAGSGDWEADRAIRADRGGIAAGRDVSVVHGNARRGKSRK